MGSHGAVGCLNLPFVKCADQIPMKAWGQRWTAGGYVEEPVEDQDVVLFQNLAQRLAAGAFGDS